MAKKKNKKYKQKNSVQHKKEDYNLRESLKKLNQNISSNQETTISEFQRNEPISRRIDSETLSSNLPDNTGVLFQINESINSRYDKLKDDISNVSERINESTSNLRIEIEGKLNKKVNSNLFYRLFYGAISALIVIATLIYLFSYSEIIKDTKTNKTKIEKIINKIDTSKENIKTIHK